MNRTQSADVKKELRCESCGASFTCYPVPGACWCAEVTLSDAARDAIKDRYTQCLCPDCLGKVAAEEREPSS